MITTNTITTKTSFVVVIRADALVRIRELCLYNKYFLKMSRKIIYSQLL